MHAYLQPLYTKLIYHDQLPLTALLGAVSDQRSVADAEEAACLYDDLEHLPDREMM